MRNLFGISIRGVMIKKGKVLLVNEDYEGVWETPGGRMKHDETLEDTLRRELLEETGYDVKPRKLLDVFKHENHLHILFLVKPMNSIQKPRNEATKIRWFSKEEIKNMLEKHGVDDHDVNVLKRFVNGDLDEES